MPIEVQTKPFDINRFWEKTPTPLKYILLIAVIISSLYFLILRKVDTSQLKELAKIEQGIDATYTLIDNFEKFQVAQNKYNDQTAHDLQHVYTLITELNESSNKKLNLIIKSNAKPNQELLDRINELNNSYDKLLDAYQPTTHPIENNNQENESNENTE